MRLIRFFIVILITVIASQGYSQINLELGLQLHYPMDGNAGDSSGNGIHGIVHGSIITGIDRFGNAGGCYDFDGTNDWIDTETTFDFQQRSVSCWFKSDANPAVSIVFAQDANTLTYGSFHAQTNNNVLGARSGGNPTVTMKENIGTNDWYHIVLVRTANTMLFYLNGEEVASGSPSNTGSFANANDELVIGIHRDENTGKFNGKIDDMRIYDRALSPLEVQTLYCPITPYISIEDTTISTNTSLTFTYEAYAYGTITWLINGIAVSSNDTFTHQFNSIGQYEIIARATDGFCEADDTTIINVDLSNHIRMNPKNPTGIAQVFPNPTSGLVTVAWKKKPSENATYSLRSIHGQLISELRSSESEVTIDLEQFSPGWYLLEVSTPIGKEQIRVMRQ